MLPVGDLRFIGDFSLAALRLKPVLGFCASAPVGAVVTF
jgi:hypothetical protein